MILKFYHKITKILIQSKWDHTWLSRILSNTQIRTKVKRPTSDIVFVKCRVNLKLLSLGWRRYMEDAAICEADFGDGNSLYAVFDGHGGNSSP
jgi:hypothetical protein